MWLSRFSQFVDHILHECPFLCIDAFPFVESCQTHITKYLRQVELFSFLQCHITKYDQADWLHYTFLLSSLSCSVMRLFILLISITFLLCRPEITKKRSWVSVQCINTINTFLCLTVLSFKYFTTLKKGNYYIKIQMHKISKTKKNLARVQPLLTHGYNKKELPYHFTEMSF